MGCGCVGVCVQSGCGWGLGGGQPLALPHLCVSVIVCVCVGNCSINQSSAVIVGLIVCYIPAGLEALVYEIYVHACVYEALREKVRKCTCNAHMYTSTLIYNFSRS